MTDFAADIAVRYANRDAAARELKHRGASIVGYVGLDVPEELLLAAGMVPVRLEADVLHPGHAADRFGVEGHPVLRSLIAELLGGRYGHIDRLIIGSSPRNLNALRTLIRELQGSDPAVARFETCLVDVTHAGRPVTEQFNLDSLKALREQLQQWSGRIITNEALQAAVALCNSSRGLLLQFNQRRCTNGSIDGVTALQLHALCGSPDRARFNDDLRELLQRLPVTAADDRPRVVYSGTPTDTTDIYQLIEAEGLRIIDDDQDFGARAVGALVDPQAEPLVALAQAYSHRHASSASFPTAARRRYLLQRVSACQPDAVLFQAAAYDHPGGWDLPELRTALDGIGMPHATLDPYCYRDSTRISAGTRTLVHRLRAPLTRASR